jgi:hypothetical protein
MARVKSTLQITGSINGLSFYTIRGGDTVYVRTKGGPSARRMKVGEEFATVRKHQAEWEACVKFSKMMKGAVGEVAKLGDFNVSPVWNGLGKKIMALDAEHPVGERSLQVTRCPDWLAGYNLNRRFPFNSIFRGDLQLDIDTQQLCRVSIRQTICLMCKNCPTSGWSLPSASCPIRSVTPKLNISAIPPKNG